MQLISDVNNFEFDFLEINILPVRHCLIMTEKHVDILKDFHELLQRCCSLEDSLLRNLGALNCVKHQETDVKDDFGESKKKLLVLKEKTCTLEKTTDAIENKCINQARNLDELEERFSKIMAIYEKKKETLKQVIG